MRRFFAALTLTTAMSAGLSVPAHADVAFNISIGEPNAYYMGLGNYYGVPQDRVYQITQRGIPSSDLATVLYIASLAHVDPFLVADLRMSGMSWMDVSHYYGLGADVYYVNATPYGPYTSYYQPFLTHPRSSWATLTLGDAAVVNLTNLLYSSQYYGVQPYQVMRYRARGDNFLRINRVLFQDRGFLPSQPVRRAWVRPMQLPDRFRAEARAIELRRNVRADRRGMAQAREQATINERVRTREDIRIKERTNVRERTRIQEQVAERNRAERRADERAQMKRKVDRVNERAAAGRQAERAQARQRAAKNERVQERARVQKREASRTREREMSQRSNARMQREMASRRQMRTREMARSRQQMSAQHASRNTRQMRSQMTRRQEGRAQRQRPQHQGGRGRN
jgi:hypothetical protein